MIKTRVYISGIGVISPLGSGVLETTDGIRRGLKGLGPLTLFPVATNDPTGQVSGPIPTDTVPRTHQLARLAADQAMAPSDGRVDAIVLGITTGGMSTTEDLLEKKKYDPGLFRHHAAASVAEDLARRYRCIGPAITICTACSSGAVAIKFALEMVRTGLAVRVLAGGADALCRLTYYGFKSLQLIDPEGSRPLDKDRRGMSLAEGAAMLLLTADRPENAVAEILGAGLSCDAYHPVRPHPKGRGALAAMRAAIRDAGISESDIDYINLHGTGTPDNDLSEAEAIHELFPDKKPFLSSIKGGFGHSLAAAGAIETVVSAISISKSLIPANIGCRFPDPGLKLDPVMKPFNGPVRCVLSNSFGFGGNNASMVISRPGKKHACSAPCSKMEPLAVLGYACLTGAGDTESTIASLSGGRGCKGCLPLEAISRSLSPRLVRRLKRLPRLVLSLAVAAHENSGRAVPPSSVFVGTSWGSLSETYDFLTGVFETGGQFPSPTDFVGSVHNAAAGQVALHFQSTGANITTSGGDQSFEQALLASNLLTRDGEGSLFVIGADESHSILSGSFDESVSTDDIPSDGGGAFCLGKGNSESGLYIHLIFYENVENNPEVIASLVERLGGRDRIEAAYGAVLTGMPGVCRSEGEKQLQRFLSLSAFKNPVIDYRSLAGEFASSSAVAAVLAVRFMEEGKIPGSLCKGQPLLLNGKGVLVLGLGKFVTAVEVFRR